MDLSQVNFEKLRAEFAEEGTPQADGSSRYPNRRGGQAPSDAVRNPQRMDYYKRYQEIVADYNREKDRATVEATFAKLLDLAKSLDEEQQCVWREGLSDDEMALFDLIYRDGSARLTANA